MPSCSLVFTGTHEGDAELLETVQETWAHDAADVYFVTQAIANVTNVIRLPVEAEESRADLAYCQHFRSFDDDM